MPDAAARADAHRARMDRMNAADARREARTLQRADQQQLRAEELGHTRPRYAYARLDGRRTWLSALTSITVARASWGRFDAAWLETQDRRVVMLVTDVRTSITHGVEIDRDELTVYLHGAEVMGARLHLLTGSRNARAAAASNTPRITLATGEHGDK